MFKYTAIILSLVIVQTAVVLSSKGVDISAGSTVDEFKCLKSDGHSWVVVRGYESLGRVDTNGPHSILNARAAGITNVDAYIFPCTSCGNGAGQVEEMVKYLKSYKATIGMVWFDIEGPGTYWSSSHTDNRNFFNSMLAGAKTAGVKVGVYTSASQWEPIMGSWDGGKALPLWYAHYDNSPSFSDFSSFGGWTKPHAKQYVGSTTVCGLGVDLDYY
ncbi:hypothetical protein SAMD00019534_068670 [Acytostelium subglobosum LB1]|uniref:hypothetical protein n=1 Tax=Acytostelium subglobosum LB1 TaxID=1410327 RepID=UPI0006450BC9|nr:hypothetical protein SAMD00019534_068670 [Acytostelium subglobosum LB1]GAM23692.1 hypothetical protein SAMD00019534_068670 [Acytostelium subglobosum LB1]|eukprot:XP_012753433.1 hypothetical protein SAMD00019534_068670 [Acytostelium subglobosum LB1]